MSPRPPTTTTDHDATKTEQGASSAPSSSLSKEALGLAVFWCSFDADLLGAWLPVATGASDRMVIVGRGGHERDGKPVLSPVALRPSASQPLRPFCSPSLSRCQLQVRALAKDRLQLHNRGRLPLAINGRQVSEGEVRPGDLVELGQQLLLLCDRRPQRLSGPPPHRCHTFGHADAHGFVGESVLAWQLRAQLDFVAPRMGHVLIHGESGTGKELAARAIHVLSDRSGALVSRNAATLPAELVDAELFGNLKGYPNPGTPDREGLVGAAHGGTLFLDEVADLPEKSQAHLLRLLDAGEYQRLGESRVRHADLRVIAATNLPKSEIRHDLLARFEFLVETTPLRRRRADVPLLVRHLLKEITAQDPQLQDACFEANGLPRLAPSFVRGMAKDPFEINVRGLKQRLWAALASAAGGRLQWPLAASAPTAATAPLAEESEPEHIQRALDEHNGSLNDTWRALGLSSRHALARLIKKHGLRVTRRG